jgi:hypothetical protein
MNRKNTVVLNLVVLVELGEGAGPTQDIDAIQTAALEQLDGFGLDVQDEGRAEASGYELWVYSSELASPASSRQVQRERDKIKKGDG